MSIEPIKDNVLVIPKQEDEVTSGGIHLPQSRKKGAVVEGLIAAAGPLVKSVTAGMSIFFDKHSPTLRHVKLTRDNGQDVPAMIMKEADIMGYYIDE